MKGNIVIGQSGGPTAVINSSLAGAVSAARELGVGRIYGMHYGIQGFLNEDLIDMGEYIRSDADVEILKRTPSAFLGSCRYKLPKIGENEAVYQKIFEIMEKYDIACMLYIGGNDSMDTIKMLSDYAALKGKSQRFMGVPKTVDNDLPVTDHCPGYASAAKYIATTLKETIRDNASYGIEKTGVMVGEIMGRHAGWLTAAAALCRGEDCEGPDMIYLPEVTFDMDDFLTRVKKLADVKRSVIIAVSEGLRMADGRFVCELGGGADSVDAFGHKKLSGCGILLANRISSELGLKTRAVDFSTPQRSASHLASLVDINEAFNVGYVACKAAYDGQTGRMVTIDVKERNPYEAGYSTYDIHSIANVERSVPLDWIIDDGTNVSDAFLEYARPLIMGELQPVMVNGIPRHLVLRQHLL